MSCEKKEGHRPPPKKDVFDVRSNDYGSFNIHNPITKYTFITLYNIVNFTVLLYIIRATFASRKPVGSRVLEKLEELIHDTG